MKRRSLLKMRKSTKGNALGVPPGGLHGKMLSTLYNSYKDNIDAPYKEEFRKTVIATTG
jgi:hypothetical protein